MEDIAKEVIRLVGMGIALAFGFYIAKKGTNKLDELIYTHSKEYKELVKSPKASKEKQLEI